MPEIEIDAVVTSGPIAATYGAFYVRPLFLAEAGSAPRQLFASLVCVQVPPHPEMACTFTDDLAASEESVVRAVLDQLNEDYNILTDFPYPWGCPRPRTVDGIGPRSAEDPAVRRAYSDRFVWMCQGLETVADVVDRLTSEPTSNGSHPSWISVTSSAADGETPTGAIPAEEAILLATFEPFQVVRRVNWRYVLSPFPYALWHEPWVPGTVLAGVEVRFEAGEGQWQKLTTSLEDHDGPITHAQIIATWRAFIDSRRKMTDAMTASLAAFRGSQATGGQARDPRSAYQRQSDEALARLVAAVDALESEANEAP